jgi:DNA-binding response OmpR family regulator
MRVLLLEPDTVLATIYAGALSKDGHEVTRVVSAQAAVHAADQARPDVVVLELQLPRHNGVEFLYEFRSYSEWATIPAIIHTTVPATDFAQAATLSQELGVVAMLHKPLTSLAQLRAAVRLALPVAS